MTPQEVKRAVVLRNKQHRVHHDDRPAVRDDRTDLEVNGKRPLGLLPVVGS